MNTVMGTMGEGDKTLSISMEAAKRIFVVGLVLGKRVGVGVAVDLRGQVAVVFVVAVAMPMHLML